MKHQKNVIGWTLFELVVLLAFFVYPSYVSRQKSSKNEVQYLQNTLNRATKKIQNLKEESGELKTKLEDLGKKEQLKSKQLPSCIEKGLAAGFLFQVKIIGEDKYIIDNKEFTSLEILKNISFIKKEDSVLIIGDEAIKIPRAFFTRNDNLDFMELRVRRPLSDGII